MTTKLSAEVNELIKALDHPLEKEINRLRGIVLETSDLLTESVKWNSPSYAVEDKDCLTLRIYPPQQIQLVFHRGANVQAELPTKFIDDTTGLMVWKTNDRGVITFKNMDAIAFATPQLQQLINDWIVAIRR